MRDIIKTGLILLLICVVAAVALGATNEITKDKISEQRFLANEMAKKQVLSNATSFEDVTGSNLDEMVTTFDPIKEVYVGLDASGNVLGYVFKSTPTGFSGVIEVVTGITIDGTITGVRIGNHQETPGLGAKAKDAAFYSQYAGKLSSMPIGISKSEPSGNDIQAITGATISSVAVTGGVNASVEAFNWILEKGGLEN
jgi:Na+-translocating ferredoxin:NAD+ oxidoreductase subunit G